MVLIVRCFRFVIVVRFVSVLSCCLIGSLLFMWVDWIVLRVCLICLMFFVCWLLLRLSLIWCWWVMVWSCWFVSSLLWSIWGVCFCLVFCLC